MPTSRSPAIEREGERALAAGRLWYSQTRVPVLDGVRGLAIAIVAIFHFSILAHTPKTFFLDNAVNKVTSSGWMGVDLFFVLSGFLITGILYDSKYGSGYFRKFYARRVLRIFPLYYGFLLFMLLLVVIFSIDDPAVPGLRHDFGWYAVFLANVRVALDNAHHADLPVTAILWSVSVEEQFYFVWPAIVLVLNRQWLIPVCCLAIGVALIARIVMSSQGANIWLGYSLMPTRMDALAVGALIALLAREPKSLQLLLRWAPFVGVIMLALLIALGVDFTAMYAFAPRIRTYGYTIIALMFGALLVATMSAPPATLMHRFFASSIMRTLGRHSYAMYVIHYPIGYYLSRQINIAGKFPNVLGSSLLGEAAFVIAAFVPTFVIAWLSWHVLESPFLRLKRYFSYAPQEETRAPASLGAPALAGGD